MKAEGVIDDFSQLCSHLFSFRLPKTSNCIQTLWQLFLYPAIVDKTLD